MQGSGVIRKYPFTGGAEALTGRGTAQRTEVRKRSEAGKFEVDEAGGARKLVAQSVDFVSRVCGSGAI